MKKVMTLLMICLVSVTMVVAASADPGAFVQSPSNNSDSTLVEAENATEACTARLVICAYAHRDTLGEEARGLMEEAYASVAGCEDLGTLNGGISSLAEGLSITSKQLAVSDLFTFEMANCDAHDGHGVFTVTVKPHVLDHYAGLMFYDGSSWKLVEHSEVSEDGTNLTFDVNGLYPHAILVHDGTAVLPEPDKDGNVILTVAIIAAVAAVAVILIIVFFKKKKKEEPEKSDAQNKSAE